MFLKGWEIAVKFTLIYCVSHSTQCFLKEKATLEGQAHDRMPQLLHEIPQVRPADETSSPLSFLQ